MSISLIRKLGLMPPNKLTPAKLALYFKEQKYAFLDGRRFAGLHAVGGSKAWMGHTSVGKGVSPTKIALVGKGITFDSGGISIKPSKDMHHMKFDMLGAATVLSLEKHLASLEGTFHLFGCCAENTFHNDTMRPSDILTYADGTKVEIIDTDAEGRLILADGILEARKYFPDMIITIATLTGSARAALGNGTAVFGNNQPLIDKFLEVAGECKEEVWQLPIWKQHRENIKGQKGVSDIKNLGTIAGASTAAAFLEHFIGKDRVNEVAEIVAAPKWLHLDIAGSAYKDGMPTGVMHNTLKKFLGTI